MCAITALWITFFSALTCIDPPSAQAAVLDRIVATVGHNVILLSDLKKFREDVAKRQLMQISGKMDTSTLKSDEAVLDLLIKEKLLEGAVKTLQLSATEEEVEVTVTRIERQNKINRAQLIEALREQGSSFEAFHDNVKKELEKQNLIQKEIKPNVVITEQDIDNYLKKAKVPEDPSSVENRLSHIVFKFSLRGGRPKAIAAAERTKKELDGGASFQDLAQKYSDDSSSRDNAGDLGWFRAGSMDAQLEKVLGSMKPGDVTRPIVTKDAVHIFKLTDRRRGGDEQASSQRDQVRRLLQQQEFDRQLELWYGDQRAQAHVKVLL